MFRDGERSARSLLEMYGEHSCSRRRSHSESLVRDLDDALPKVYSYLRARCGSVELAEELTSATFVQAALEWSKGSPIEISIGWLITVARNKLIDHWRHLAVVDRSLTLLEGGAVDSVDPWDAVLDQALSLIHI